MAGLPRGSAGAALAAFLGTVAQIPLGGLTVILELHPLAVMSHFLLALVVVALAVVVALEAWSHARGLGAAGRAALAPARRARSASSAARSMVVTGAIATASGPHPGADDQVERLGLEIRDTVYVHVRATAVFGIGFLLVGWQLVRVAARGAGRRCASPRCSSRVLLAQMLVGEIQYRNALPWGLVLVHVTLAAAIWGLTVASRTRSGARRCRCSRPRPGTWSGWASRCGYAEAYAQLETSASPHGPTLRAR